LDGGADSAGEEEFDDLFDLMFEEAATPTAAVADRVFAAEASDESSVDSLPANGEEMASELLIAFALAGGVGADVLLKELLSRLQRSGRVRNDLSASRELVLWLMGGSVALAGSLHSFRRRKGSKEKHRPS